MLLEATKEGDTNAQYGLAIALICEFDDDGKDILLSTLNKKKKMENVYYKVVGKSFIIQL